MTAENPIVPPIDDVVQAALEKLDAKEPLDPACIMAAAETRIFSDEQKNERIFKVLVVTSPDRWLAANTVSAIYDMPRIGTAQFTRFKFSGVSLSEWDDIESAHIIPQWQGDSGSTVPPDFRFEQEKAAREKMAHVLEVTLSHKIPGSNWGEKIAWIEKMNPGEMQAMYMAAQYDACNIGMQPGPLLTEYNELSAKNKQIQEFAGFEGMDDASKSQYFFRMQRPGDDYILEFPLKGISAKQREEIDRECKEPDPPKAPKRDPVTKQLDFKNMVPNFQDKQYLDKCRVVGRRRTVMFFNACLPFDIPGKTLNEQFDWLGSRLVGDVVRLKNFITDELTSYYSRYRFF